MIRRTFAGLAVLIAAGASAQAQIIQGPVRSAGPIGWTSLSIGWMQQQGLCDPDTNACWSFGSAPQWRATLEFPAGTGATFGVVGTTSRVPLTYSGGIGTNSCSRCDADANISQVMGLLRIGGGSSFHQVIDVSAGMTLFSNFRQSGSGMRLGSDKIIQDFTFMVGYGFGYSFSPRFQVMLVQDYGLVIHKRQPGSSQNTAQQSNTRLGLRYGLGERRR